MTPKDVNDHRAVETAEDFVAFLNLLVEDYQRDVREAKPYGGGEWATWDLGSFLDAWSAWLTAMAIEGRPHFPKEQLEPSWKSFALQLAVARRYE
ncbi:DUF7660 family protein [Lentzea sp. CA-135723]|uniref:DUF7660 family protein n=1 Tax=Lentzea sp. CA-135723 TaxID=3239950 RepID=UPI003D8EB6A9